MNKRGFTLIEVLFVIAIVAILLAAITPYLRAFHVSWESADRRAEVIQNARVGMDKMVRDIRQAASFSKIKKKETIFEDVDGNTIRYKRDYDNLKRNDVILTESVPDLDFEYYDEEGEEEKKEEDIRLVKIFMTVTHPDEEAISQSFVSMAFIRSTSSAPEGHMFSKNSDFSTEDTTFSTSDIFYVKAWSNVIDYDDIKKAEVELKKGKDKVKITLTNNHDGTYTGSQDLTGFKTGVRSVKFKIEDNDKNKYDESGEITII